MAHLAVARDDTWWGRVARAWLVEAPPLVFPELLAELGTRRLSRHDRANPVAGPPGSAWATLHVAHNRSGALRTRRPAYSPRALEATVQALADPVATLGGAPIGAYLHVRRLGPAGEWLDPLPGDLLQNGEFRIGAEGPGNWLTGRPPARAVDEPGWPQAAERWCAAVCAAASRVDVLGGGFGLACEGAGPWELGTSPHPGFGMSGGVLIARSQRRVRGPFWLTVVGAGVVRAVGGVERFVEPGVFASVQQLPNGAVACRATRLWSDYGPEHERRIVQALEPLFTADVV